MTDDVDVISRLATVCLFMAAETHLLSVSLPPRCALTMNRMFRFIPALYPETRVPVAMVTIGLVCSPQTSTCSLFCTLTALMTQITKVASLNQIKETNRRRASWVRLSATPPTVASPHSSPLFALLLPVALNSSLQHNYSLAG